MNSPLPLQGLTVWVTRPRGQERSLCERIRALGGRALSFPTIEILPPQDRDALDRLAADAHRFTRAVFVSRNAVSWAARLLPPGVLAQLRALPVFCPGAGSAAALRERGFGAAVHGAGDSEALLALPELQRQRVAGETFLIVRGVGGRELLRAELERRGANVCYAQVYRRAMPERHPEIAEKTCREFPPDWILIHSCEGLRNLCEMMTKTWRQRLLAARLAVLGRRMADLAVELGFTQTPVVAAEPSDAGLLDCMLQPRSTHPARRDGS